MLEYSESAHQKILILWLVALFRPTVLLQEEVKVPSLWHDFTLFMTTYDLLRSPSTYVNTKRGYRRDFFSSMYKNRSTIIRYIRTHLNYM